MTSNTSNFRRWWRPPRQTSELEEERRVTFLELFYDLVYVVVIAEIAHSLATHVSWRGLAEFGFLFALVWLAWLNGTFYHDLHGNNDIRTRVFTFAQMFTVAAMAVFAHNAFGAGSVGFALAFAAYQLILTYLWWRTGVHDPNHRPYSRPYSRAFLLSTLLFICSALVPMPWRTYLWAIGLTISIALPVVNLTRQPIDLTRQGESRRTINISASAVERFDLFIIIVLGEVIVGVVRGVAEQHELTWVVGMTAILGMLVAIGMWWPYFDFIARRRPLASGGRALAWIYLHLVVALGIVAAGAATLNVVLHTGEALPLAVRWLLIGAVATVLLCIALFIPLIRMPPNYRPLFQRGALMTVACALGVVGLGFVPITTIPLLGILDLLMLLPIIYGVKVWVVVFGAEELIVE